LWDLLWVLRVACSRAGDGDRVHFQVLADVHGDGRREPVKLWRLIGPGDDATPVMTIMLEGGGVLRRKSADPIWDVN
jgi:hypothetical protein